MSSILREPGVAYSAAEPRGLHKGPARVAPATQVPDGHGAALDARSRPIDDDAAVGAVAATTDSKWRGWGGGRRGGWRKDYAWCRGRPLRAWRHGRGRRWRGRGRRGRRWWWARGRGRSWAVRIGKQRRRNRWLWRWWRVWRRRRHADFCVGDAVPLILPAASVRTVAQGPLAVPNPSVSTRDGWPRQVLAANPRPTEPLKFVVSFARRHFLEVDGAASVARVGAQSHRLRQVGRTNPWT